MAGGALEEDEEITGINVTPFVDVMLVLLVIFMVTATYIVNQTSVFNFPKPLLVLTLAKRTSLLSSTRKAAFTSTVSPLNGPIWSQSSRVRRKIRAVISKR